MASFLEEEKEIKKEEKRKLPTITIAIVAHGNDLITPTEKKNETKRSYDLYIL